MAAQSKTQLLTDVHALLKKGYKLEPRDQKMTVLEAVVYGICHEGTTREQANQALSRFKDDFYDWNEVRVSSLDEIQGVLAGLPDPEERAYRIRRFLRQLFEKTYAFALDGLGKKPLKEAAKQLQEYEALQSDYVLATVIQLALGGHAIPVDASMRRGLERLHVADKSTKEDALRGLLERAVPKNRGGDFVDLMEELTHDTCIAGPPDCPRCDLKKICPTGHARLIELKAGEKAAAKASAKAASAKVEKEPAKIDKPAAKNAVAAKPSKTGAKVEPKTSMKAAAASKPAAASKAAAAPSKPAATSKAPASSKSAASKITAPASKAAASKSSKAAKPKVAAKAKTKPAPVSHKGKTSVAKGKASRSK
jgi:endonuclease III